MKSIEEIRQQLSSGLIDLTQHALIRIVQRNISQQEIQEAGENAMIIEDYPNDKYSPSCCCWALQKRQDLCIFKFQESDQTGLQLSRFMNLTRRSGINFQNGDKFMFRCHICGSDQMKQGIITQVFMIEGKPVIIEDIPAKICVRCQEAIFDISTAEKIRRMIHGNARPKKSVMADIFEFAA